MGTFIISAVFDDGGDEPGKIEICHFAGVAGPGCQENQLAGPPRHEFVKMNHLGGLSRILDEETGEGGRS